MAQDIHRPLRHPRHPHRTDARQGRHALDQKETSTPEVVQDEATIAYIKRVLCRESLSPDGGSDSASVNAVDTRSLGELLPPLTSSNTVDTELYALIAVILDNFVQSWYSRITSDPKFVDEIVQIIAHCTGGLEQRLRHVDLESLLLDELPDLALKHIEAVRIAQDTYDGPISTLDRRARFHVLRPHMALHPPPGDAATTALQQENEDAWCLLLVNRILPLILPPEDYQNPCLKVLVSEIFAELIFRGGICGKASEGWLWWEGVTNIISVLSKPHSPTNGEAEEPPPPSSSSSSASRLEQYGLLSSSAKPLQAEDHHAAARGRFDGITTMFWSTIQLGILAWLFFRSCVGALVQAQSLPSRTDRSRGIRAEDEWGKASVEFDHLAPEGRKPMDDRRLRPIVGMRIWACATRLFELDERMPWLTGVLSLAQWLSLSGPGRFCRTNGRLDRLLSSTLRVHVLSNATLVPSVLRAARSALFPHNALAPSRPLPLSDGDLARIRGDCARAIVGLVPDPVRRRLFATHDTAVMHADVAATCLDLFDDPYLNEHLVVAAVDLLAVRLFPELLSNDDALG